MEEEVWSRDRSFRKFVREEMTGKQSRGNRQESTSAKRSCQTGAELENM